MKQPYHHGSLRQTLLEASEAILNRDGIDGLTLRAAAREAGVSHGAPAHHFGDLTGLLTELAASGFIRLRERVEAAIAAEPENYMVASGRGYLSFARSYPGIFQLMFRSERLNWSAPSLSEAGPAAFALLSQEGVGREKPDVDAANNLILASTRWSLMHGLASLVIDGRLGAMVDKAGDGNLDLLIEKVLLTGLAGMR